MRSDSPSSSQSSSLRRSQSISSSQVFTGEKPSFLRFVARKCNDFSRTCRYMMSDTPSVSETFRPIARKRDNKFAISTYESVFDERIHSPRHETVLTRDPKHYLNAKIHLDPSHVEMMENYRGGFPFVVLNAYETCVVCGKLLCHGTRCFAPYGCRGCTRRVYCSVECFGMDWPSHVKYCKAGEADFLIKFLLNRIKHQANLYCHLQKISEEGFNGVGRGAVIVMFEQIEALKMFLKYNHDFNLEYYYSVQYLSVSSIDDKFIGLNNRTLYTTLVKSYNPDNEIPVIVMVKNNFMIISVEPKQPFCEITLISKKKHGQQQMCEPCSYNTLIDNWHHFEALLSTAQLDFRTRRVICLTFYPLYFLFGKHRDEMLEWREILERYYLKGEFRINHLEKYQQRCSVYDSESSYRSTTF